MEDIEIARSIEKKNILDIAKELNIDEEYIEQYGKYKAKISNKLYKKLENNKNGKLVLVTAISPTPLGEGKTTMAIGIADGLRKINKKSILALREPSLGPVFGIKGGATGGGYSQVVPMEDINLHFTGDIHAITSANNLLASLIDNHIYFGNELGFERVIWKRCVDLNDRQLRKITCGLSGEKNMIPREDGFDISVASEIMAILCLAKDEKDLKERLGNIVVGYNREGNVITARELKAEGSLTVLLKDAIKPNLVQTLEHTPTIIHGGPFANIAHGCNSIIATKLALKLSDYVITEAGFGADLGAEKFLNIKTRIAGVTPNAVVCVATLKALKYHGGVNKDEAKLENIEALNKGVDNLLKHVDNLKNKFSTNVIVAINKYIFDSEKEIELLTNRLKEYDVELSLVESWEKGGNGAIDIANKLVDLCEKSTNMKYIYDFDESIETKIEKVCKNLYGASDIEYSEEAIAEIRNLEKLGYDKLPICMAKTQYSFSDDPNNLECKEDFTIHIKSIELKAGAGFIVVITGKIFTMPGLPRVPAAEAIDLDNDGNIVGLF